MNVPAAAIVDSPNMTPKVESIASPAVIITKLSIMPNPIAGGGGDGECGGGGCEP